MHILSYACIWQALANRKKYKLFVKKEQSHCLISHCAALNYSIYLDRISDLVKSD